MPTPEQVAAALVSPWPTWWVEAHDEASLLEKLGDVGSFPQADLFEPWDPGDPWRARVLFPPLDRASRLVALGTLEDGDAPGFTEWLDRGRISEDRLDVEGFEATLYADAEHGGLLIPDLETLGPDPWQEVLVDEQRGATAEAVRHRTTGRIGLHVSLPVPERDPTAERRAVLTLVAAHLREAEPGFGPRVRWWFELGRVHVLAWRLVPAKRPLPTPPLALGPCHLERWNGELELQVDPPVDDHEDLALALSEELASTGLSGARARWIGTRFHAVWTAPPGSARPPIGHPHRWVPGCPDGLEEAWLGVDPEWWSGGGRCFVRYPCGLRDRDLLPKQIERPADPVDRALMRTLSAFGPLEPVSAGFAALRLQTPALDDDGWQALVDVLGMLPEPAIGPVVYVRMRDRFTLLLERVDLPRETPFWSAP